MAPQDDLTAERAAIALLEQMGLYGHPAASQFIGDILAALKTARQAALREAARVICPYCAAPDRWSAMNEYGDHESRETKPSRNGSLRPCSAQPILDRLAGEGAPAPIDLLPKLNDDGGYGEHF